MPLVVGTDTKIELSFPSPADGTKLSVWTVWTPNVRIVVILDCNVCNVDCPQQTQTDTSCQETFVQLLVSREL